MPEFYLENERYLSEEGPFPMNMTEQINRPQIKAECKTLLRSAQVSPKAFTALYLGLTLALGMVDSFSGGDAYPPSGPVAIFVSVLTYLMTMVLGTGFILYCMSVRRGERAEFLTLFDGFSFVGKVILLYLVEYFFIFLWTCLLIVPGIIAVYRYRFAIYNLCEDPGLGVMEAINRSKRQTLGYKSQLFLLDLSYLGWGFLAQLPTVYFSAVAIDQTLGGVTTLASVPSLPLQTLISGGWLLVVGLFYLPVYQCAELSYFEIAGRTSGVGPGSAGGQGGPDNLGGYNQD